MQTPVCINAIHVDPTGSSWCVTSSWTWRVPSKLCCAHPTGGHASSTTTGEWRCDVGLRREPLGPSLCGYQNFLRPLQCLQVTVHYKDTIPMYWPWRSTGPQGAVLPGNDHVRGADVHLVLVLRHRGHGHCRPYLQVHRVPRVSHWFFVFHHVINVVR